MGTIEASIDMRRVAEEIDRMRKTQGMTQKELAEKAEVSLKTIQRVLTNKRQVKLPTLGRIAKALDVGLEFICPEIKPSGKDIGSAIRVFCAKMDMNILELAEKTDVTATTIYAIMKGERKATDRVRASIESVLFAEQD